MLSQSENSQRKYLRDPSTSSVDKQPSATRRKFDTHTYPPQFWNSLSKVILTRKALKEFDRRTQLNKRPRAASLERRPSRLLRSHTRRLKLIAKNGGLNLSHLRSVSLRFSKFDFCSCQMQYAAREFSPPSRSKSSSRFSKRTRDLDVPSTNYTSNTSTTGTYDAQFEQTLVDQGIYSNSYRIREGGRPPQPGNIVQIRDILGQSRPSLSPSAFSDAAFEDFQERNYQATAESKAMSTVIPVIIGAKDHHCETAENEPFSNLEMFAPSLAIPQPDKYYGANPNQIDSRVRAKLGQYLIPSTDDSLPAAPSFFLEAESAQRRWDITQRQVTYDGAIGARAILQLQNYGKSQLQYDGNAYSSASSYHPGTGTLQIYATHPRQSATGESEYYTTQLDAIAMTGSIDGFRRGATAYRNMRNFTDEQRRSFIAAANTAAQRLATTDVPPSRPDRGAGASFVAASCSSGEEASTD